jgi:hypothetical protein
MTRSVRARDSPFHSAVSPLVHSTSPCVARFDPQPLTSTASNFRPALHQHFTQARYHQTPCVDPSKQKEPHKRCLLIIQAQPDSSFQISQKHRTNLTAKPKLSASPREIVLLGQSSWAMIDLFCFCQTYPTMLSHEGERGRLSKRLRLDAS